MLLSRRWLGAGFDTEVAMFSLVVVVRHFWRGLVWSAITPCMITCKYLTISKNARIMDKLTQGVHIMIQPKVEMLWMWYVIPTPCDPDLELGRDWTCESQECPEGMDRVVGGGEITGMAPSSWQRLEVESGVSPVCRVPPRSCPHGPGCLVAMGTTGTVSGAEVLDRVSLSIRGGRQEGPSLKCQTHCHSRRTKC